MKRSMKWLLMTMILILCMGQAVYASEPEENQPGVQPRQGEEVLNPDGETNGILIPGEEKVYRFQVSQGGHYRVMINVGDLYGRWEVSVEDENARK